MSNISQRDAFWNRIYEKAFHDRNIVIISADMGAPALDRIKQDLPSQFINVGIAEQNATTIAAGLVLAGKKVLTYAIAPFITLRCLEQIRVNCCIMDIPITIVGVGAGFGYEDSGPTHHIIEDIAILRSMPKMTIHSISDSVMAAKYADISCDMSHANYIRLDRQVLPTIYTADSSFEAGYQKHGAGENLILATGSMVSVALGIAREMDNTSVIDLHDIPCSDPGLIEDLAAAKKVITLEEHFLPGGMGSYVAEIMADNQLLRPMKRIGLSHTNGYCYAYGGREFIRAHYSLDEESVRGRIKGFFQ